MNKFIFDAVLQNFDEHASFDLIRGIDRYKFFDNRMIPGKSFHIAAHIISNNYSKEGEWEYSTTHSHHFDEINILLSENNTLKFQFELNGECIVHESPSLIFIPSNVKHRSEVITGTGIFFCIRLDAATDNLSQLAARPGRNARRSAL